MPGSVQSSTMDSVSYAELEKLMAEFPDWKDRHPDIYQEINPVRFLKNKSNQPKDENVRVCKRASTVPVLSDYQDTYKNYAVRPRSTKRPPRTPRERNPPPMALQTSMRAEYMPKFHEYQGRPPLMRHEDNHEISDEKFNAQSAYTVDYPYKKPLPNIKTDLKPKTNIKREKGSFTSATTNKEYFRKWAPQSTLTFGELPTFTDSILYPDQKRHLETTTSSTFKGAKGSKMEAVRVSSPNIKLEGDQEFNTINSMTYKRYEDAQKASPVIHKPELRVKGRQRFDHQTQSMTDFGSKYDRGIPRPPKPVTPPKSCIDLKFNNSKTSFQTEQRQQFPGVNVERHPVPEPYKPDSGDYVPPSTKFETLTKHKMDYQPIDITTAYIPAAKPPSQRQDKDLPKFSGQTTTKEFFRKWDVQPRPHYGDVHEALQYARSDQYIQRMEKFENTTTNRDQYKAKVTEIPAPFLPETTEFDKTGDIDFNTVYRTQFHGNSLIKNLPKKEAAALLRELKQRKAAIGLANGMRGQKPISAN